MATVPTLIVGAVDQTDFIHDKTLSMRLNSLDFTLIDPVADPSLHQTVSVDEPGWHGRVSTIESYPMRGADGSDHRWVKVTCTNKVTATDDTAPFGLSDTPNMSTTFPYRDFGYIQTLADQTDLSTAEHRMTAVVYEPGLLPGMTVEVTSAAEGLSGSEFIITEMTVEWLRSDSPEYRIEASVEGVPPVTLGDLIGDAGCDCGVFECVPPDFVVHVNNGDDAGETICVIAFGDISCQTQTATSGSQWHLYAGATYRVEYFVFHDDQTTRMRAHLASLSGPLPSEAVVEMGSAEDPVTWGPPKTYDTIDYVAPLTADYYTGLLGIAAAFTQNWYSSISTHITYVSGPDPRYVDLPPCVDPRSGQLVIDPDFTGDGTTVDYTTGYPYGAGSLEVFVNGLDWTATLTETDPGAGDYGMAYPPPVGATVSVRYRGA